MSIEHSFSCLAVDSPPKGPSSVFPASPRLAFTDLPAPFFAELAATLAARNSRRTLASLNSTCKTVKEGTLVELWKTCHFKESYDWRKLVAINPVLRQLVREVWVEDRASSTLKQAFPKATTLLRTRVVSGSIPIDSNDDGNLEIDVLVMQYPGTTYSTFNGDSILSSVISLASTYDKLRFMVAPDARAGLKKGLAELPPTHVWWTVREAQLTVLPADETEAVSLIESLIPIASSFNVVMFSLFRPTADDWMTQAGQLSVTKVLTQYPSLLEVFWTVRVPFSAPSGPNREGPNWDFLKHLTTTLAHAIPTFKDFDWGLECLDWNDPPNLIDEYVWWARAMRDESGEVVGAVMKKIDAPSGPFVPWE